MGNITLAEIGAWNRLLCQMGENGGIIGENGRLLTLPELASLWHVSLTTAGEYLARWMVLGYVVRSDCGYAVSPNYFSLLMELAKEVSQGYD